MHNNKNSLKKHNFVLIIKLFLILSVAFSLILINLTCSSPSPKKIKTEPQKKELLIKEQKESKITKETDKEEKSPETAQKKEESIIEDASSLLEEAMDAYQDAQLAWEKGDLDTALNALDEAYALILKAKIPFDSPLLQEKNDLRLLIARRIQEIYASRLTTVGENNKTIPILSLIHI